MGESISQNLMRFLDNNESLRVDFNNQAFQICDLMLFDSGQNNLGVLQSVRTLTANIAMGALELQNDALSALIATGVVLFVFTLILNVSFSLLKKDKNEKKEKKRRGNNK